MNSIRRIKKRENGDVFKACGEGSFEIALAAPDVNLYLALASLLTTTAVPKQAIEEIPSPSANLKTETLSTPISDE